MMWMMLVCCALPLVILIFAGGKLSSGGYFWPILIGIFVVGHLAMMFRGHKKHEQHGNTNENTNTSKQPETKDKNQHSGCCH